MSETVIETRKLTKRYRARYAVDALDLCVSQGSVFGFLGPNGAGKTTTINMLLGNARPTSGQGWVLGRPIGETGVRQRIGFLPEKTLFYPFLTAREFLCAMGLLAGMSRADVEVRIPKALHLVGLGDRIDERIGSYSRGMQQRLGLAQAILHEPELVILDEPTSALDPIGRRDVRDLILHLKERGCTVFLNSHLLSEIEMTCDEVAILKEGRVAAAGRLNDLLAFHQTVEVEVDALTEAAMSALRVISPKIKMTGMPPKRMTVYLRSEEDIPEVACAIVQNGGRLLSLVPRRESLEELFVRVIEEDK
ncbi:MAG TPA: ABC transporter ATP-binding protein [Chthonomonadales bacterium]|nr:ABC transporter ATP-binding protein [Chthonomonadales bacterium]